jgi:hypothetical protein
MKARAVASEKSPHATIWSAPSFNKTPLLLGPKMVLLGESG